MFRVADTHNVRTTGYRIQIHLILYYELASYSVLHTWRLTFRVADTHDVLTLGYSTWVYCMLHRRCTDTSHRMEMHHIPVACNYLGCSIYSARSYLMDAQSNPEGLVVLMLLGISYACNSSVISRSCAEDNTAGLVLRNRYQIQIPTPPGRWRMVLHTNTTYYIPTIGYSCSVLRYALVTHIVQVTAHAVVTLYALHLQVTARRDITYETCGVP